MPKKQSIPDGTPVIFDLMGFNPEEFDDEAYITITHDKQEAVTQCLATYTELGEQDYEYYDIRFLDGAEMAGVNGGYHLTPQ